MDYTEAMEATVSRTEARAEVFAHHPGYELGNEAWAEFVSVYGERNEYAGADVLGWLGY